MIYLDHNATAPILPEVVEAMQAYYRQGFANPSSQHRAGRMARQVLEDCRDSIARMLGADLQDLHHDQLIFTSGGTESNNLALHGLARAKFGQAVISSIEHPSVSGPAERLQDRGWRLDRLPVHAQGVAQCDLFEPLLAAMPQSLPRLASLMLGNNETGVLQPVCELAQACQRWGVPLHTDAVQVVGKQNVDFRALGVATLSFSGHKLHGPMGIGALLVRHGVPLNPLLAGGFQQGGLRPGTEPVALVVGLHRALQVWHDDPARVARLRSLREQFEAEIRAQCPEVIVNGEGAPRLPHVSNLAFPNVDRQAMMMALDQAGVQASTGSACASGASEPSTTLLAMGASRDVLTSSLRFSLGLTTSSTEVTQAASLILNAYNDLRTGNCGRKMHSTGRKVASDSL